MPQINYRIPRAGVDQNSVADPEVATALTVLLQTINALDASNLIDDAVTKAKVATDVLNAFPKLLTPADVKMAFGSTTVTFAGTQSRTGDTVAHGLGTTPTNVQMTVKAPNSLQPMFASPYAIDSTNIAFATTLIAATHTGTVTVYWVAYA